MSINAATSASIVALDPKVAEERDRAARELLAMANSSGALVTLKGVAHTIPYTLQVLAPGDGTKVAVEERLHSILGKVWELIDSTLNEWNDTSEVSRLNAAPVGVPQPVSVPLGEVLVAARRVFQISNGLFEPCFKPIQQHLLGKAPNGNYSDADTEEAARNSRFDLAFSLDDEQHQVTRLHSKAVLGLCGISKGWAVDRIIADLRASGFGHALMEWGGEIKASGSPDGSRGTNSAPWRVAIVAPPSLNQIRLGQTQQATSPGEDQRYIRVLSLQDGEAVATSGDYEHMSEPSLLLTDIVNVPNRRLLIAVDDRPSLAQVTVVTTGSCLYADALATVALLSETISEARIFLDRWRCLGWEAVTDYTLYQRQDDIVAPMALNPRTELSLLRSQRLALQNRPARVVVVGAGLAGLAAAMECVKCGSEVILCEKGERMGGNSAKATTGINSWGSLPQNLAGIAGDSRELFVQDTLASAKGGGHCDVALVHTIAAKCREAVHWLIQETGLTFGKVHMLGGHSKPRTHRVPDQDEKTPVPIGFTMMAALIAKISSSSYSEEFGGRLQIKLNAEVCALDVVPTTGAESSGTCSTLGNCFSTKITGVRIRDMVTKGESKYECDAVILTTGGFGNDNQASDSLIKEFAPHLIKYPTTHASTSTGDGVKMGRSVGAQLVDMERILVHPIGFIDPKQPDGKTKYLGPEALRVAGFILLDPASGKRFCNEVDRLDNISNAINKLGVEYPGSGGARYCHLLLGPQGIKLFGPSLFFYRDKVGLFQEVPTVAELAKLLKVDEATLRETLVSYDRAVASGKCPATGRTVLQCPFGVEGPFAVAAVTPCIHYNHGGLLINPSAQVQRERKASSGSVSDMFVPLRNHWATAGLFAAGEVSAGLHGALRLGGNTLLESVVFGRIAAERAASMTQKSPFALAHPNWTCLTVREVRRHEPLGQSAGVDERRSDCGEGSLLLIFNLPSPTQLSGLRLGEFLSLKVVWDGRQRIGHYSPFTLPDEVGVIGVLARCDKGSFREWLLTLQPGDVVEARKAGGLALDIIDRLQTEGDGASSSPTTLALRVLSAPPVQGLTRLNLIAGGSGIGAMLQIISTAFSKNQAHSMEANKPFGGMEIHLIYAAERKSELSFETELRELVDSTNGAFKCYFVLHFPPEDRLWNGGVGFVSSAILAQQAFPADPTVLNIICGPPIMQELVIKYLQGLGHTPSNCRTVDEALL
jgi:flavocytochrome c